MLGNILLAVWEFLKGKMTWVILIVVLLAIPFGYFAQYVEPDTALETNLRKGSADWDTMMELKSNFSDQSIGILVKGKTAADVLSQQNLDAMRYVTDHASNIADPDIAAKIRFAISPAFMLDYLGYDPETQSAVDLVVDPDGSLNKNFDKQFMWTVRADKIGQPGYEDFTWTDENGNLQPYYHGLITLGMWGSWENEETTDFIDDIYMWADDAGFDQNVELITQGLPIFMNYMANELPATLGTLMGIGAIMMLILLTIAFKVLGGVPRRWLVVLLVLLSIVYTLGICGMVGIPLTNASVVVFPILLGMSVDSCVQTHNRYDEEIRKGKTANEAARTAIKRVVRPLYYGMTLQMIGFAAVFVVDNQQITYFGLTLIIGCAICMVLMLFVILGILFKLDTPGDAKRQPKPRHAGVVENLMGWLVPKIAKFAIPLVIVGVIASGFGWVLDDDIPITQGFEGSVRENEPEFVAQRYMQLLAGGVSPWNIVIKVDEGDHVLDPEILEWVRERSELAMEMGDPFTPDAEGKTHFIGSASNLGDIFANSLFITPESAQEAQDIITSALPRDLWLNLVTEDMKTMSANFMNTSDLGWACGDSQDIFEEVFNGPGNGRPEMVSSVTVTGLAVLGPIMDDVMDQSRSAIVTVGVGGLLLACLIMFRFNWRRVIAVAFPILLVLGWSSLYQYEAGFDVTLMTALLPAQMMAVGIELTILLLMRYYEERDKGEHPMLAMTTAMSRIGRAIIVSGGMVFIGFAVMVFAFKFPFIQDFGIVTMIDMVLIILAVLVVMPALVLIFDLKFKGGKIDAPVPPVEELVTTVD